MAEKEKTPIETVCVAHRTKNPGNASIAIRDDGKICAVGGWDGKYVCCQMLHYLIFLMSLISYQDSTLFNEDIKAARHSHLS